MPPQVILWVPILVSAPDLGRSQQQGALLPRLPALTPGMALYSALYRSAGPGQLQARLGRDRSARATREDTDAETERLAQGHTAARGGAWAWCGQPFILDSNIWGKPVAQTGLCCWVPGTRVGLARLPTLH